MCFYLYFCINLIIELLYLPHRSLRTGNVMRVHRSGLCFISRLQWKPDCFRKTQNKPKRKKVTEMESPPSSWSFNISQACCYPRSVSVFFVFFCKRTEVDAVFSSKFCCAEVRDMRIAAEKAVCAFMYVCFCGPSVSQSTSRPPHLRGRTGYT